jgi:putative endonuclease
VAYYVYILLCHDDSYYTGYTQNLKTRLEQHWKGTGSRYTRRKKPKRIVYMEQFPTRSEAMRREREIKRLTHQAKTVLINTKHAGAPRNSTNNP